MRPMLRKMLEHEGYKIMDAPDDWAVLVLNKENPTDLVITDIIMPGKGGIEKMRELKKNSPS